MSHPPHELAVAVRLLRALFEGEVGTSRGERRGHSEGEGKGMACGEGKGMAAGNGAVGGGEAEARDADYEWFRCRVSDPIPLDVLADACAAALSQLGACAPVSVSSLDGAAGIDTAQGSTSRPTPDRAFSRWKAPLFRLCSTALAMTRATFSPTGGTGDGGF